MVVQCCCVASAVAIDDDDKLDAILARLDSLETTVVQQRAAIDIQRVMIHQQNATIQQLREDIDRQHFDNLATKRDVVDLQAQRSNERFQAQQVAQQQHRALASSTCAEPPNARLQVDGICSCSQDVVIGNRSVLQELDNLTTIVHDILLAVDVPKAAATTISSCADILARTANSSDGVYQLSQTQEYVYCDMSNGGWTLLLRYVTSSTGLSSWDIARAENSGAAATNWTLTPASVGHVNMTAFDLQNHTLRAVCDGSEFETSLLDDWAGGIYGTDEASGTTGSPVGWAILARAAGQGRHRFYMCGSAAFAHTRGFGFCSGAGVDSSFGNHLASLDIRDDGINIGCAGDQGSYVELWYR